MGAFPNYFEFPNFLHLLSASDKPLDLDSIYITKLYDKPSNLILHDKFFLLDFGIFVVSLVGRIELAHTVDLIHTGKLIRISKLAHAVKLI